MLRTSGPPVRPDIQRAVTDVVKEDSNFDRVENRSAHRISLVRPVTIDIRESDDLINAFSRNISDTGIGLVTNQLIVDRCAATLTITRLKGPDLRLLGDCRWCKPYGDGWFLSGWQFIALKR